MLSAINSISARDGSFTDDVAVELKMFAQSPALLLFVTETLRDRKPFQRLAELAFMRGDDPRQAGGELRAERHLALAFVGKIK